ncbi:hypothetical protein BH23ACT11_BH23ACT11_22920 [soil metagenome]
MSNPVILRTEALTKRFVPRRKILRPGDGVLAVHEVSIDVRKGTTLGIVGESGSSKTTLGRMIVGLTEPTSGGIFLDDEDTAEINRLTLRRRVQYVFQDPFSSLNPRQTIGQSVSVPLRHLAGEDRRRRREHVAELIEVSGLRPELIDRYPHELSGGQRQRVVIARAIAANPDVLVLDEPVSALDVSIQAQILALLRRIQEEFSLTYLFISHDLAVVESLCDRVAVMREGEIVESGSRQDIFDQPQHSYTQRLLAAVPGVSEDNGTTSDSKVD